MSLQDVREAQRHYLSEEKRPVQFLAQYSLGAYSNNTGCFPEHFGREARRSGYLRVPARRGFGTKTNVAHRTERNQPCRWLTGKTLVSLERHWKMGILLAICGLARKAPTGTRSGQPCFEK